MNLIKFGHPQYLYFLCGTSLLILLYIYAHKQKRKASERFSDFRLLQQLTSSVDFKRQKIKLLMVIFSFTFLAIALARPQFGSRLELVKRRGLDIMVALDISLSMQAEDVKPNRKTKSIDHLPLRQQRGSKEGEANRKPKVSVSGSPVATGLRNRSVGGSRSPSERHPETDGASVNEVNRFQKAKHEIQTLIDKLNGDRVGLIIFAGDSFVQCPLTDDYDAAKMLLDVPPQPEYLLQKGLIQPGTDIGRAIWFGIRVFQRREAKGEVRSRGEYANAFSEGITRNEHKYKVLILVTDGENLVPLSDPLEAAKEAAKAGIHVYTLGVGAPGQGTPIPLHDHEGKFMGYKRDGKGELVLTRLNDTLLRKISALGGGRYYLASAKGAELDDLYKDISSLERKELEKRQFTQHEERFQYFLFLALVLLAGELILSDRYHGLDGRTRTAHE